MVRGKSVDGFWQEINEMVKGAFRLNDLFPLLLDALYAGIGVDRAVFAMLQARGDSKVLIGQLGGRRYCSGPAQEVPGGVFPINAESGTEIFDHV